MVSQLLFGEFAEVIAREKQFIQVRSLRDNYEGWCQTMQLASFQEEKNSGTISFTKNWTAPVTINGTQMQVPLGSSLAMFEKGTAAFGAYTLKCEAEGWNPSGISYEPDALCAFSKQYLNTPYLWGGRSVFGIDCSGFAQQVFGFFNKELPRDAYQQVELGEDIGFLAEARPGDLAYFDNEEGRIIHVGILLGPDSIIHAAGRVRIDQIDAQGIINSETQDRTHRLRIIKRL
jgi:cell wall-associated NlpC family hydrolase